MFASSSGLPATLKCTSTLRRTSAIERGEFRAASCAHLLDAAAGYAGLYAAPDAVRPQSLTLSLTTNFDDSGEGDVLVAKEMWSI